jgi:hypothetical protein
MTSEQQPPESSESSGPDDQEAGPLGHIQEDRGRLALDRARLDLHARSFSSRNPRRVAELLLGGPGELLDGLFRRHRDREREWVVRKLPGGDQLESRSAI